MIRKFTLLALILWVGACANAQVLGHIHYSPCDQDGWQYVYEEEMVYPAGGMPYADTIEIAVIPCGYLSMGKLPVPFPKPPVKCLPLVA